MCIDYMHGTVVPKDTKEQAVELFPSDLFYALQKYAIKKSEIENILERIAL